MSETPTQEPVKMPGKYELIAELAKFFPAENSSTIVATGDDATVVEPDGNQMVTASKVFVENFISVKKIFSMKHMKRWNFAIRWN